MTSFLLFSLIPFKVAVSEQSNQCQSQGSHVMANYVTNAMCCLVLLRSQTVLHDVTGYSHLLCVNRV